MAFMIQKLIQSHLTAPKKSLALEIFSLLSTLLEYNPFSEKCNKLNRFWVHKTIPDLLKYADQCFEQENYMEVYQQLNRLKFRENDDVHWRICRALFKMNQDTSLSSSIRTEIIREAYDIISNALAAGDDNPNVHKWMAVITDLKSRNEGTIAHIKSFTTVKFHLEKASELNPHDVSVLYMLGKWCFELSNFTQFQRFLCKVLYAEPPHSTYQDAYNYFLQAEEASPRFYLPNTYMLGYTSLQMKHYFSARKYFYTAANWPSQTNFEKSYVAKAKTLSNELHRYDIAKEALARLARTSNMTK